MIAIKVREHLVKVGVAGNKAVKGTIAAILDEIVQGLKETGAKKKQIRAIEAARKKF